MLKDLGHNCSIEVLTDASAAKGIASRRGLGKTRHIDVHYLWVQERVNCGDIVLTKCWGGENPADLLTKYLTRDKLSHCLNLFGTHYLEGGSAEAPALTSGKPGISCLMPSGRW